jgi:putative alpha-1,2-mannosidase
MFFYGQINTSFEHHTTSGTAGVDRDYCQFNFANSRTIEFKIATSFIGIDQAKHNLDLEINNHHLTFDSLHKKATEIWRDKLNVLDISKSNATEEQKTIIYSNLYRLNMYPNESFENRDSESNPYYYHVSSVLPVSGSIGTDDVETKGQVREGKTYVNSGF